MANSTKIWLSHSSDYENFEEGVKDADSFSLTIPTTNTIRWVEGAGSLLVGTSGEEWRVYSSKTGGVLSPTNFAIDIQAGFGSNTVQPIVVNAIVMFIDMVGRKIHEFTWSDSEQKYLAPDLTAIAEHITDTGIVSISLQKNPDMIIWCVLADGSLISLTYNREQNVIAWSDHPMADAIVQSVCVVPDETAGEDSVYISTTRNIALIDYEYIEKFESRFSPDILANCYYVDCGITATGNGIDTYTKLCSHFNGTDGAVAYTDPVAGVATFAGTAQLDTSQKKFGTASLLLDGNSDYVTYPDSANYDFGTADFTVDFGVRFATSSGSTKALVSHYLNPTTGFSIEYYPNITSLSFLALGGVGQYFWSWVPTNNVWYHIAVSRSGTSLRAFVDGVQIGITETDSSNITGSTSPLMVGALPSAPVAEYFNGWIDELRISKGIARWTANFTPPTTEYAATSNLTGSVVSGLTHLEGEVVSVLADGVVQTKTVASGSITVTGTPSVAQVGLPYTYELQPMRLDMNTQQGTGFGGIKKIPEIIVSLLDSANVKYGDSLSNLYSVNITGAELINKSSITGLFSGDVTVHLDGGFSVDDSIIISGSDPLPCTVRCIIPKADRTSR